MPSLMQRKGWMFTGSSPTSANGWRLESLARRVIGSVCCIQLEAWSHRLRGNRSLLALKNVDTYGPSVEIINGQTSWRVGHA